MPLVPALGRQRQADLCELEASLGYRKSSRATQRNLVSTKPKPNNSPAHRNKSPTAKKEEKNQSPLGGVFYFH